jgi:hypothetical protein
MSRSIYLHQSRFRIVSDKRAWRVYDAQTVSDEDVKNGLRAKQTGSFRSLEAAKAFCHKQYGVQT